ncbi:Ephrin-B2 [Brachionus plicatilis]|uniref:Ephrin-B2 n=1 Tax=Brachionus plicatilis TaxID=10195 RepID=A0A3M7PA51_BRAPC|nr:Ephrin-B2 [Brachionus plicatilis]
MFLLFFVFFGSVQSSMNIVKLPSLYWSTNNRLFTDMSDPSYYLKLNAHIGDSIDLVCPRSSLNDNSYEYSIIYKVGTKYEFDNCLINPENYETVPILKCDKINSINSVKFTIYFVKYSPVPNALEFEEDKEYYFLSTSSGAQEGINHQAGGLCSKFNMKFSIKINSNQNTSLWQKLMQKSENKVNESGKSDIANNLALQSASQLSKLNLFVSASSKFKPNWAVLIFSIFFIFA